MYTEKRPKVVSSNADSTSVRVSPPLSRRSALRYGLAGAAGVLVSPGFCKDACAAPAGASPMPRAKSIIQIWLHGGMSHNDTWDPKPESGRDYMGNVSAIPTNVPGMQLSEWFPELAKHADKFSLIRSMTHADPGHETASYLMNTGHAPGERLPYPAIGAVLTLFRSAGYKGVLPPHIVLTRAVGRFPIEGFLGPKYKPFVTGGDPAGPRFEVEGIVVKGITEDQQRARRQLIESLDTLGQAAASDAEVVAAHEAREQAYDLILGEGKQAFDLTQEEPGLRESYGINRMNDGRPLNGLSTFGQCCLAARRLVEKGVPYITINYPVFLDTHSNHFETMSRQHWLLDAGLATLLADLQDRGLLDQTLVWCTGEFGRTPKIAWNAPWNGGRGHHNRVFTALVAGGGFKGGCVVGASDDKAEEVKERPVYPVDLLGSIYHLAGIDSTATLPHPDGLDARVLPSPSASVKSAGILREIM